MAPIGAIEKVLDKAGWSADEVELWEVNEAFACVAMFAMRDLGIPHDKINVNGGGTALGHPIGASGIRMIYEVYKQLQGKAEGRQLKGPTLGLTHNLGGRPGSFTCSVALFGTRD